MVPDKLIVGIVSKGYFQDRFGVVEVVVARKDRGTESHKALVNILSIVFRMEKMRDQEGSVSRYGLC